MIGLLSILPLLLLLLPGIVGIFCEQQIVLLQHSYFDPKASCSLFGLRKTKTPCRFCFVGNTRKHKREARRGGALELLSRTNERREVELLRLSVCLSVCLSSLSYPAPLPSRRPSLRPSRSVTILAHLLLLPSPLSSLKLCVSR